MIAVQVSPYLTRRRIAFPPLPSLVSYVSWALMELHFANTIFLFLAARDVIGWSQWASDSFRSVGFSSCNCE